MTSHPGLVADGARPRVALVSPYWDFWEASAPGVDLRAERLATLDRIGRALEAQGLEPVLLGLLDAPDRARELAPLAAEAAAVLVVVSMAAPPTHTMPLIVGSDRPAVFWALSLGGAGGSGRSGIVRDGATVGTPQITNLLVREGRPFTVLHGPEGMPTVGRVGAHLRAEVLAQDLDGLRLARVGRPIPGYLSVDVDDQILEDALGVTIVTLEPAELRDLAASVSDAGVAEREATLRREATVDSACESSGLAASLRYDLALAKLVDQHQLGAGTLNCHIAELRHDPANGVAPCLALGQSTSRGVPWTCTGDVLTSVAMLVGRRLGGASFYHEVESLDPGTGDAVLANTGEHDLAWRANGSGVMIRPNPWFEDDPKVGAIAWFPLAPGPATLVAVTPRNGSASGLRFVSAEGRVRDEVLTESPTVGGLFRFAGADPQRAWERWATAGVNHHSAAVPGHIAEAVELLAQRLGVEHVRVT